MHSHVYVFICICYLAAKYCKVLQSVAECCRVGRNETSWSHHTAHDLMRVYKKRKKKLYYCQRYHPTKLYI